MQNGSGSQLSKLGLLIVDRPVLYTVRAYAVTVPPDHTTWPMGLGI